MILSRVACQVVTVLLMCTAAFALPMPAALAVVEDNNFLARRYGTMHTTMERDYSESPLVARGLKAKAVSIRDKLSGKAAREAARDREEARAAFAEAFRAHEKADNEAAMYYVTPYRLTKDPKKDIAWAKHSLAVARANAAGRPPPSSTLEDIYGPSHK